MNVTGTRVPVAAFFNNLEHGATAEQFLAWFPGVKARQVKAVLQHEAKGESSDRSAALRPP